MEQTKEQKYLKAKSKNISNKLENILYSNYVNFHNFDNLTEERINELRNLLASFQKNNPFDNLNTDQIFSIQYYKAKQIIYYLCSHLAFKYFHNFDEKIFFFIEAIDPQLNVMKIKYKDYGRNLSKDEKIDILKNKKETIQKYLGYDDNYLGTIEAIYFKKKLMNIGNKKELIKGWDDIKKTDSLTNEKIDHIDLLAQDYHVDFQNIKSFINYILFNDSNINLSKNERYLLLVFVLDKNLDLLKIYQEESNFNIMQKRAKEEIGFFNKEILAFEKEIKNTLYPDKKLSVWEK